MLLVQHRVSKRLRTPRAPSALEAAESAMLEHAQLLGFLISFTLTAIVGHTLGVGSTYLLGLGVSSVLVTVIFNDYILRPGKRQVHLASYLLGMVS